VSNRHFILIYNILILKIPIINIIKWIIGAVRLPDRFRRRWWRVWRRWFRWWLYMNFFIFT
jgi:hypothetical protein